MEPIKPEYSKWGAIIVLTLVSGLVAYEIFALRGKHDKWATITTLTVMAIKEHWWIGVVILGTLGWLIVHFLRRVF